MGRAMRKVLVLGSNAFSGQDLVDLLLDDPENEVVGVSRSVEPPAPFLRYRANAGLERFRFRRLDLNHDVHGVLELLDAERPRWIANFAAQSEVAPSWEHPEHWFETNCVSLARIVNHLRRRPWLERWLQVSSPEVYGTCSGTVLEDAPLNPSTPYAASKAAADLLLATYHRQFGFPVVTVRATNVYGARQQLWKIIPRTAIYLRLGRPIELHGGGAAVKSYIHVRDVSRGERAILERGRDGTIYHLSPDRGIAVRDVVCAVCDRMGKRFEDCARAVGERPGQDRAYVIGSRRARGELGWSPGVSFEDGIAEVIDWVERHWDTVRAQPLEYRHRP